MLPIHPSPCAWGIRHGNQRYFSPLRNVRIITHEFLTNFNRSDSITGIFVTLTL